MRTYLAWRPNADNLGAAPVVKANLITWHTGQLFLADRVLADVVPRGRLTALCLRHVERESLALKVATPGTSS